MKTKMAKFKDKDAERYNDLFKEVKGKIDTARISAVKAVDRTKIKLYWDIGKTVVERQKQHGWGSSVVERLALDLNKTYGKVEGFSANNLWRMRIFYLTYCADRNLAQLVQEIPWGQNIAIFQKVKDSSERKYYITSCAQFGWSKNVLLNQIKAGTYRLNMAKPKKHNFTKVLPARLAEQADESIRDVCTLDFLGIRKEVVERELEARLVEKIKRFILELGKGFAFIGNQHRLTLGDKEYYIDLLFFNRVLKCLVAVELKTGSFEPEYAGKMDFYLHILNDQYKLSGENSPIGIILCADKNDIVVEYALRSVKNPMGVTEYRLTSALPKELQKSMPYAKQLKYEIRQEL
jgi:predicted nuclease of restriction endonuclease-like (RecB) superfamily